MKKTLAIISAVFITCSLFAQQNVSTVYVGSQQNEIYTTSNYFGIKGGLNLARETNGDLSTQARTGINIGLFYELSIAPQWVIQPELVYSMQGGKYYDSILMTTAIEKFDYINIPFIFKYYFSAKQKFSIDFGPQIGFLVSAKKTYNSSSIDISHLIENKYDIGLALGISYRFGEDNKFDITLRGILGLINYNSISENRNSVSQISLGYRF